jgi:hypothetical protein
MRVNTRTWRFLSGAAMSTGLACGGSAAPAEMPANVERTVLVAQRCPALDAAAAPLDRANARVFVEVVEVSAPALPQPIGRWLDENAVNVRSSANLVAFPDVPTSMPWGQCVDAVCSSMKRSITLTARLPESASEPLGIELRIDEAAAEGASTGPKILLETTLHAMNQEPVVLPPAPELSAGSLVVTAYLLQKYDDLHRVMECSVRQAERSKQLGK